MPKDLKASVTLETKSAEARLKALVKAINQVQNAVNKTANNNAKLSKAINQNVTATNKLKKSANDVATAVSKQASAQHKVTQAVKKTTAAQEQSQDAVDGIIDKVKALARAYLGVMGMRAVVDSADNLTGAQNQLNNLEGGSPAQTQKILDKVYGAAVRSRGDYAAMMKNVGKSMTLSPDAFHGNVNDAILFQEIMAKAYKLSGASAAEQSSSMYQMIQALGSGVLQGDELRSLTEGASMAAKQIEKFAQEVYGTDMALKEMGSKGMLTSELVVAAILDGQSEIQEAFDKTNMTFGDAWTRIKNDAQKAFEPVFIQLTAMLNDFAESGGFEKIGNAFIKISNAVQVALAWIQIAFSWISENWDWLSQILIIGLSVAIALWVGFKIAAITAGIAMAIAFIAANLQLILILVVIGLIIGVLISMGTTAQNVCSWIAESAFYLAAIIIGVLLLIAAIGLITGQWYITVAAFIVMAIIALVLLLVGAFFKYTEQFVGVVYVAGALIWNIVAALINAIIQFVWANFVVPWIGVIEWIVNVANGGFDSITGIVANAVGQWISWVLEFGKIFSQIIDAVAGTDLTGTLSDLSVKFSSWGKNENAVTYSKDVPWTMQRKNLGDAWDNGTIDGANIKSGINDWGSNLKNKFSANSILDGLGLDSAKLPDGRMYGNTVNPLGYDPAKALGNIDDNTGKTAGSAGKIADSMELAEEDLAYLKDVANMEWKKEFTTATIKVDMNNSGATINNQGDLDGIVTKLTTALYEELDAVAHGVYA